MKRITAFIISVLVICTLITSVYGAELQSGIYNTKTYSSSCKVDFANVKPTTAKVGSKTYSDFYKDAEKFNLIYNDAVSGDYYTVFVIQNGTAPSADNVVYIDQKTASDGKVTFNLYPSKLVGDSSYNVYISGESFEYTKMMSFSYTTKADEVSDYILGDVNGDQKVNVQDLTALARHLAKVTVVSDQTRLKASDTNCDGKVSADDLTHLAKYVAKIISAL